MNTRMIFRVDARTEYLRAIAWYEDQRAGLGREFESEVEGMLEVIAKDPKRFAIAERDIREASLTRFPYTIYYHIRRTRIDVLSVFNQSRDPEEWRSRL